MADVEQWDIGDLFRTSVFEIPKYQRSYSWGSRQVEDMLQDLHYTYRERNAGDSQFTHYFGTVVLHERGIERSGVDDFKLYQIIDGQQRLVTLTIIASCLNEELESLSEQDWEETEGPTPSDLVDQNRATFIEQYETTRLNLDSINSDIYTSLVVYSEDADRITAQNLPQRRLVEATETTREWFAEQREAIYQDRIDDVQYYDFLKDFTGVIRNALEVTTYIVDDETEAGRLFEVVNDRGKDLTTLDRIKSYLVYCTSRTDNTQLAGKVYRRLGEVIKNITENGGGDDDLDIFVNYHWIIFTGEVNRFRQSQGSEYTEIHRRVKHLKKHADRNQPQTDLKEWIEAYLDSIISCSEAYAKIENPTQLSDNSEISDEIIAKLDGLNQLPVSGNFYPLLISSLKKYGIGNEFRSILSLCEIFSFRVYNIAGRRTDAAGNPLRRYAYWIEWAGENEKAERVFSGEQSNLKHNDWDTVLSETCRMLETQIGRHCPDSYFQQCLLRDDIFEGADQNDGWTGVRTSEALTYLLYNYERHLRIEGSQSSISQIPSFSQWKREGISLEHIYPQNPDSTTRRTDLDEVVDSLGNLVLLGPEDNSGAGNSNYSKKCRDIYSNSSMRMINELPAPSEGWSSDKIRERAGILAEFALQQWGGLSEAYVNVNSSPTELQLTELTGVAHEIRIKHANKFGSRIPSVYFGRNSVTSDGTWTTANQCPQCDSTVVNLNSTEEWDASCNGCGSDLREPVYKFKQSQYI